MNDLDRTTYMGSGDAAAACGVSPFVTPLDVYLYKRGEPKEYDMSASSSRPLRFGQFNESFVLSEFTLQTGMKVADRQKHIRHPDYPHIGATVDGITFLDNGNAVVEAKTTSLRFDDLPDHIVVQVQEQLAVTGLKLAFVPVLFSGRDFKVFEVEADEGLQATIISKMDALWSAVQDGNPPPPVSLKDVNTLFPHDYGGIVEADRVTFEFWLQIKKVKETLADLQNQKNVFEMAIKSTMGENSLLTDHEGTSLATWKCSKGQNRFDSKAFQKTHPELYDEFCTPVSGTRRFLIK
jgi:predicted phage-related endonuclease|tara:strand:- start:915 stop:1796 length:882 start_codon:yes stop_codon:yes gene_type:complete